MKTKSLTVIALVSIGIVAIAMNGFSAERWQKPKKGYVVSRLAAPDEAAAFWKGSPKYSPGGIGYDLACGDIDPEAGTIVQHDQIGYTFYETQQHQSMPRMISVTGSGYRHFSWTYCTAPYPGVSRYIFANCKDPGGGYLGGVVVDGGESNAGYSNQSHLHDGTSLVIGHRTAGDSVWWVSLSLADGEGSGLFARHWDIPDYVGLWTSHSLFPQAEVLYDPEEERDYIHITTVEPDVGPNSKGVGYERCYFAAGDTLVCQTFVGGTTATYRIAEGTYASGSSFPVGQLDTVGWWNRSRSVAVSPVSKRVGVAYLRADEVESYIWNDVFYVESMTNCDDWIEGSNWPPPKHKITDFGYDSDQRPFFDVSACYDYQDSLHVLYVTCGTPPGEPWYFRPDVARLYHWSKKSGSVMIASAIWEGTGHSNYNANIAKMSVSALDPIYHPEGDSVYLFAIWTQSDTGDNAASGYTNGELYGCGSFDGGQTWGQVWNLTNTKTPGCAPGECLSEHWPSLSRNLHGGDLHIQYICDRDAGQAINDEGGWTSNPVMYLHLSPWDVSLAAGGIYRIEYLTNWYQPPLKVTPGDSRDLVLKLFSIGNLDLEYSASGDHDCILGSHNGTLAPGDSITMSFTVQGSGACDDTLIDGNIILTTNEGGQHIETLPVLAVVADDYYECPVDSETVDTLDNGVLRLYTNANCMEWIHDIGTSPDTTHEVFFRGGTIVATACGGDTLVGRYMGHNDQHSGARDKLYREECDVDWEPDFWILYTKNIFMHDLNPPADYKWYWWEMSKQVKFFRETAPDVYRHLVIKYVTVRRHDPPSWWPDHDPFTGYEDTYIGVVEDIDCPADTSDYQHARNVAGYDDVHHIAWQRGWDYTGAHPEYNDYYCGIALADAGMAGESTVPYGSYNVRNDVYLYPQGGWGWKDGELCQLASASGSTIQDPDAIVDRSWVFTARKIDSGSDPDYEARFTVILAVAPGGIGQLQEYVDSARAIVTREKMYGGLPALCGDCNGDFVVNIGDVVTLVSYLFKDSIPPKCPTNRGDCNSDKIINVGDVVYLIGYLYRGGPTPVCPGIWY
ncbi:MAG: dockerin type I repeat-containing protein [Candidatus Zixiibacteriota bacterium]